MTKAIAGRPAEEIGPAASADALIRLIVRQELRGELERALAPVIERLDALAVATPPALVDVVEAALRVGKSPATVRAMCARGDLPARRVGRSWRVDLAALRPLSADAIARQAEDARR